MLGKKQNLVSKLVVKTKYSNLNNRKEVVKFKIIIRIVYTTELGPRWHSRPEF